MPRHRFTDTRQRIETAAIRLFVEHGVSDTSVRDIARAVDISEGALYRHFASKEDLVWTLFERHYVEFARRLQALAEIEGTARQKLATMIREFCRAHDDNPVLFRFLLFVQHDQLTKLGPADADARPDHSQRAACGDCVGGDSRSASGVGHGDRVWRGAGAGPVRGVRGTASGDGHVV